MLEEHPPSSPRWSSTTKTVIGLAVVSIFFVLVYNFRNIIGPLLLAFILAYLLHPLVARIDRASRLSWRASVNLVYIVLIILLIGFFTISGLAIIKQIQSLITIVNFYVNQLPTILADLQNRTFTFGLLPFEFNLAQFDLQALSQNLLSTLQTTVGRLGTLVSSFAASAASTIGWGLFVLLISYFLLAESRQVSNEIVTVDLPGYTTDLRQLGNELKNIMNAFLRGQLVMFILTAFLYTTLLTILGVSYAVGIAILAGTARFVPYIGPLITWTVISLVTLLQGANYFGLPAWQFTILVVGLSLLLDQILDNLVNPRFLGKTLGVHPAAVLVAAIVLANLIGLIGLVLAAPVVATLQLLGRYISRKMLDLDPWPPTSPQTRVMEFPWVRLQRRIRALLRYARKGDSPGSK
jgi:predicted PurR-regulated permease PerM